MTTFAAREITPGAADEYRITVTVNGERRVVEVEPRLLLAHLLREGLGLTGTHLGCDTTNCGACTVLVDGAPVKSCTMLAVQADGREVTTVEGLGTASELDPVQEGFSVEHGLQCGFCTPGMMLSARALLDREPDPSEEDVRWALSGNLCRCTGYQNIVKAVLWAARKERAESGRPASDRARRGQRSVGWARAARGSRTPGSSAAAATTSTTSTCPACCTWRSCAARWRTPGSSRIDTSKAWEIPGVRLVLTGEMMAQRNLAWMPTLSYDTQAVLATDKVRFQGQEVCVVVADDPYIAKDGCEAIDVEYEPLPVIVNPEQALAADAPVIRDDKEGQTDNTCYRWEVGDAAATERAFAQADRRRPRSSCTTRAAHPSPIECCGSIADYDAGTGKLTVYMTTQAPHIIRAAVALVAELPEHMIRIISPDIGGGFGNKVPVYPGYVASILASILVGKPVKWIEDKSGNLLLHGLRPRHVPRRADGPALRRQDPRRPDARRHRPGRLLRRRPAEQVQGRAAALGVRLLQRAGRAHDRTGPLHEQGARRAWPTGARSG